MFCLDSTRPRRVRSRLKPPRGERRFTSNSRMKRIHCGAQSSYTSFICQNGRHSCFDLWDDISKVIFCCSPESVKSRSDVFYLQPERSCVPDSPVWYSTMPLPTNALEKMLHRVKMVKEINVALLTS